MRTCMAVEQEEWVESAQHILYFSTILINNHFNDGKTAERMLPTHWGALREFVRCHHLHIQVFALRLAPGFDEPLEHLRGTQSLEVKKGHGGEGRLL